MKTTLQERLGELMKEYGLKTQQELAVFAGVSKGLVGQWFNGSTGLGKKPLLAFEKKTRFSTEWLADGTGKKYKDNATAIEHTQINGVNNNVGNGVQNIHQVNHQKISSSLKNENHPDYTMPDDSMSPVLPKGCGLWINRQDKERINGKIYRIDWQGAELVRQLFFDDPAQIRLHAHNSQYPDKYVPKDQIRIMGRVVSWQVDDY